MMNVIDHRILVPASPDRVWRYISNLSHNSNWMVDCRNISFLTTMHTGPGTRWRITDAKGRDRVAEITVWYDRLGYEYKFVDGVAFTENKGQIRLQEIAEGTVVQWTFNYETTGLFGNLRNMLSLRREVENNMVESLRTLWRVIKNSRDTEGDDVNKSIMRDAPDVEARAHYKPRHPSAFEEKVTDLPRSAFEIVEPAIEEDDTRPRLTESTEPDFLSRETAYKTEQVPKVELEPDTIFKPPKQEETPTASRFILPGEEKPELLPIEDDTSSRTSTTQSPKVDGDTGKMSVFELFGLPKPSETQEISPVSIPSLPTPAIKTEQVNHWGGRVGLRARMRRKSVKLRRP